MEQDLHEPQCHCWLCKMLRSDAFKCSHLSFCPLKLNSLFHTTSFFTSRVEFITLVDSAEMKQNIEGRRWEKSAQVASLTAASGARLALLLPVTVILSPLKYSSPRKISRADDIRYNFAGQLLTNTAERHWVIHSDKWSVVNISRRRKGVLFQLVLVNEGLEWSSWKTWVWKFDKTSVCEREKLRARKRKVESCFTLPSF